MKKFMSVILLFAMIVALVGCSGSKLSWDDVILREMLPIPPTDIGEIHTNSAEDLWLDIDNVSAKQYGDYLEACKTLGFTVDAKSLSASYSAFNDSGYELNLDYRESQSKITIHLKAPMQMSTISWPTGTAGKQLPVPTSNIGKFSYEYDDHFFVYVGNTPFSDYIAYVNACSNKGFNINYNKGDNYYYADNSNGWHVSIRYEGYNVMSIDIDAPKNETATTTTAESAQTITTTKKPVSNTGIDANFKAAMDSYENFMNEYVEFMKKYKANPNDLGLLSKYSNYLTKYAKFVEDFEKWEDTDLNSAELTYYIEVQGRVSKKLLEAAQ